MGCYSDLDENYFPFADTGLRHKENGDPEEEENFDEAIRNVNTALLPTKVRLLKCSCTT